MVSKLSDFFTRFHVKTSITMIKTILLGLSICFLVSCKEQVTNTHKYDDFKNDWERMNLSGKVKAIEESTQRESKSTVDPNTPSKTKTVTYFNEDGNVIRMEMFDESNHLNGFRKFDYNHAGLTERIVLRDGDKKLNDTIDYRYDDKGNVIYQREKRQDKLFIFENVYDSLGSVIKQLRTTDTDTFTMLYTYEYNDQGKKRKMRLIDSRNPDALKVGAFFKYDERGNLIEEIKDGGISLKETKYYIYDDKGRQIKKRTVRNDVEWELIVYDENFNPVEVKTTQSGKSYDVLFNKYEWDEKENWIKKETSRSRLENGVTSPAEPFSTTTRKISYY